MRNLRFKFFLKILLKRIYLHMKSIVFFVSSLLWVQLSFATSLQPPLCGSVEITDSNKSKFVIYSILVKGTKKGNITVLSSDARDAMTWRMSTIVGRQNPSGLSVCLDSYTLRDRGHGGEKKYYAYTHAHRIFFRDIVYNSEKPFGLEPRVTCRLKENDLSYDWHIDLADHMLVFNDGEKCQMARDRWKEHEESGQVYLHSTYCPRRTGTSRAVFRYFPERNVASLFYPRGRTLTDINGSKMKVYKLNFACKFM